MTEMMNKNYAYFQSQLTHLMKKHQGKFVVVKDQKIIQIFDNLSAANKFVINNKYPPGTFLIHEVDDTIHHVYGNQPRIKKTKEEKMNKENLILDVDENGFLVINKKKLEFLNKDNHEFPRDSLGVLLDLDSYIKNLKSLKEKTQKLREDLYKICKKSNRKDIVRAFEAFERENLKYRNEQLKIDFDQQKYIHLREVKQINIEMDQKILNLNIENNKLRSKNIDLYNNIDWLDVSISFIVGLFVMQAIHLIIMIL